MEKRRPLLGPAISLVLLCAVGIGIWTSHRSLTHFTVARGLVGSEKGGYFEDQRVTAAFAAHGLVLIARRSKAPKQDDFGFPSGEPAARELTDQLLKQGRTPERFTPFFSPIIIATWRPIAKVLVTNSIAHQAGSDYYILDLKALLKLVEERKRWSDLAGSESLGINKEILIYSSDVRTSNSAEMYLALASYVIADQRHPVDAQSEVLKILPAIAPLFLRQSNRPRSSAWAFKRRPPTAAFRSCRHRGSPRWYPSGLTSPMARWS